MATNGRLSLVLFVLSVATGAFAQGSAAGYGQGSASGYGGGGGGGIGGGGSRGMRAGSAGASQNSFSGMAGVSQGGFSGRTGGYQGSQEAAPNSRPEDDPGGVWESRSAILTPGDRVEYKFEMKAGETIFAAASSDAFDPALEFDDANKKKLTENDDRVEGDQQPFLIYRCAEAGTYTLKVLSYHSVAGGKFDVTFRTFKAINTDFTSATHTGLEPIKTSNGNRLVFRISAQKGKDYDLGFLNDGKGHRNVNGRLVRVVGPTGVEESDFARIATADNTMVFTAKATGDFYAEFWCDAAKEVGTGFRQVVVAQMKVDGSQSFDLQPRELKILEFPVKPDLYMRTTWGGGPISYQLYAPAGDHASRSSADPGYETNLEWTFFRMNIDSDTDVLRVFHGDGTARWVIRATNDKPETVTLKNDEVLPEWDPSKELKSSLEIGDAKVFLLKSKKSELMHVAAMASHFQLKLEILRMNGDIANSMERRRSHTVDDNLYFPDEGSFLVRISCSGNGGSGDFELKRDVVSAVPYALGGNQILKLNGTNFGLYSVDLEAGKRYELLTDQPVGIDLLDEDGQFLTGPSMKFDKVDVHYFVPTKSGRHRIWLRGLAGSYTFRLEANVPPSLPAMDESVNHSDRR